METLEELKQKIVASKKELQKHVLFEFSRIVESLYNKHPELIPLWFSVAHNGDFLSFRIYKEPTMPKSSRMSLEEINENVIYSEIRDMFISLTDSVLEDDFEGDFEVSKNGVKQL